MKLSVTLNGTAFEVRLVCGDGDILYARTRDGIPMESHSLTPTIKDGEIRVHTSKGVFTFGLRLASDKIDNFATYPLINESGTLVKLNLKSKNTFLMNHRGRTKVAKILTINTVKMLVLSGGYVGNTLSIAPSDFGRRVYGLFKEQGDAIKESTYQLSDYDYDRLQAYNSGDVLVLDLEDTVAHLPASTKFNPNKPTIDAPWKLSEGDIVFAPTLCQHQLTVQRCNVGATQGLYIKPKSEAIFINENGCKAGEQHRTVFPLHKMEELSEMFGVQLTINHAGFPNQNAKQAQLTNIAGNIVRTAKMLGNLESRKDVEKIVLDKYEIELNTQLDKLWEFVK